jgi:hypothetical protein
VKTAIDLGLEEGSQDRLPQFLRDQGFSNGCGSDNPLKSRKLNGQFLSI